MSFASLPPFEMKFFAAILCLTLLLPVPSQAANWSRCKELMRDIISDAENDSFDDASQGLKDLLAEIRTAKGTRWDRMARLDIILERFLNNFEDEPKIDLDTALQIKDRLDEIRVLSVDRLTADLKSLDLKRLTHTIHSILMAALNDDTAERAVDLMIKMLDDRRPYVRLMVTSAFWPVFSEISLNAKHNPYFRSMRDKLKLKIPRAVELWIENMRDENSRQIEGLKDESQTELATQLEDINHVLDGNKMYLTFENAVAVIQAVMRHHEYSFEYEELLHETFELGINYHESNDNLTPLDFRWLHDLVVPITAELLVAARSPQITDATRNHLRVISTFLVKKLQVLANQTPSVGEYMDAQMREKQEAQTILEKLNFSLNEVDPTRFTARAFDGDPKLVEDVARWIEMGNSYVSIKDPANNSLDKVAEICGHPILANQLRERFAQ